MFSTDSKPCTIKWSMGSLLFNDPFEIVRTQWNSSAHQSNQNYNGISKAVPATFKIDRTQYRSGRGWTRQR